MSSFVDSFAAPLSLINALRVCFKLRMDIRPRDDCEISEESEAMEKEIASALSRNMNIPESSVSGKMVVNMAIKELHKKIVKNG